MSELDELFPGGDRYTESFGDYLKRHREASGKTIEGISRATRISKRFLQALEANDSQGLPEEAFTRGFLKAYVKELGLDSEEALARYDQFKRSLMPTQIREIKPPTKQPDVFQTLSKKNKTIASFGALILVVVVISLVVWLAQDKSESEPPTTSITVEDSVPTEPQTAAPSTLTPLEEVKVVPEEPAKIITPVKASVLVIVALKESSVAVRLDDSIQETLEMKAGERKTLNVQKEIEIRLEDRSAFQFQFNGKPLDISGPVIKLFNRNLFNRR